jgi:hypothetical protein
MPTSTPTAFPRIAALLVGAAAASAPAPAATIVVKTKLDTASQCATTGTGNCSLRDAIRYANSHLGLDEIHFKIPGSGVQEINVLGEGFVIEDHVIIDGYTQPGSSPNTLAVGDNAVLNIAVTVSMTPSGLVSDVFKTTAPIPPSPLISGSTIQGLIINVYGSPPGNTPVAINLQSCCNTVRGNFIGTDGIEAVSEGSVEVASNHNRIGGLMPADRNVISGIPEDPIGDNLGVTGELNVVEGNYIGTDASGLNALSVIPCGDPDCTPIGMVGVSVSGTHNRIGGNSVGARNVISGNALGGIYAGGEANLVVGNFIGPGADGKTKIGNGNENLWDSNGVRFGNNASGAIGDRAVGNVIAFNTPAGVSMQISPSTDPVLNNAVLHNSIYDNSQLGIAIGDNLVPGTPTPNDFQDTDTGPNNYQNYPVLTSAQRSGSWTIITGSLNSVPKRGFRIELFGNSECDPSGYGEGRRFLGTIQVKTDANGDASFQFVYKHLLPVGAIVTSTATGDVQNTSEFSKCVTVE